jgi:hypothetical protein
MIVGHAFETNSLVLRADRWAEGFTERGSAAVRIRRRLKDDLRACAKPDANQRARKDFERTRAAAAPQSFVCSSQPRSAAAMAGRRMATSCSR